MEMELTDLMEKQIIHTDFKPKSSFHPYWAKGKRISTFYEVVMHEIKKICQKCHHNNKSEFTLGNDGQVPKEIIKNLKDRDDIIIRQADKGGGLVIQDREGYLAKVLRLLGDKDTNENLPADPLPGYTTTLELLLDQARKNSAFTKSEYLFLNKSNPLTPHFYHIPKIYKDLKNPPGRPIIAGIDSLTSNMGCYIDHFLQDLVIQLPSYVRDSGHMLEILSTFSWHSQYKWLSLNVSSLYTSIEHQYGIQAIEHYLSKSNLHPLQSRFLIDSIEFSLTHNYFSCVGEFYRQVRGTAMGAKFAPSYANLFMGFWEDLSI